MSPLALWIGKVAIVCSVLTGTAGGAAREAVGSEFRKLCVNSAAYLCRIPYSQLINARSILMGREVSTKGFLVEDEGVFTLYGSREQAAYGIREGAINVVGAEYSSELSALDERFVIVTGVVAPSDEWWVALRVESVPFELAETGGDFPPAPPRPWDVQRKR